ncbi:hypothetical protein [Streptomyces sp. NPDC014006]|uniref:hypothetical protein n=1 Tax=Streptomyces sp. NPDC014006 TaxID=3364870 RepID=UPI00370218FA
MTRSQGTADFLTALDCLTRLTKCGTFKPSKTHADLRGAMTWSTNWDATRATGRHTWP